VPYPLIEARDEEGQKRRIEREKLTEATEREEEAEIREEMTLNLSSATEKRRAHK